MQDREKLCEALLATKTQTKMLSTFGGAAMLPDETETRQVLINPDGPEAAALITALGEENERMRRRIEAVRHVIENGYARNPVGNCEHGRNKLEDCIGCYDEALLAALEGERYG